MAELVPEVVMVAVEAVTDSLLQEVAVLEVLQFLFR
jgi:hypothetical protein